MGKKKTAVIDSAQQSKKKKSLTIWEKLYLDLSTHIAESLRTARVKPEQLFTMTDGEITSIEGIGDAGLEEIRSHYPPSTTPVQPNSSPVTEIESSDSTHPSKRVKHPHRSGKKIKAMSSKVDPHSLYPHPEALALVKSTNITGFDATLSLHLNLHEPISRLEITFPHLTSQNKRIAIADETILSQLAAGKIEFDLLLSTPAMMPKLASYARLLGPKGLMPNPKSGTVTTNPEAKKKEFEKGKTLVKGETKFPLMHITLGKLSQPNQELLANLQAALAAVKIKNIEKAVLASTMSPGVKLLLA